MATWLVAATSQWSHSHPWRCPGQEQVAIDVPENEPRAYIGQTLGERQKKMFGKWTTLLPAIEPYCNQMALGN